MERRARTRRLIELGGLVAKSGLEELVAEGEPDTRAVLLGALMHLADTLREPKSDGLSRLTCVTDWRERGRAALRNDDLVSETRTAAEAAVKVGHASEPAQRE